jgi:hypothetical protein
MQQDKSERQRARGDAKSKICGMCSAHFQRELGKLAVDLGETTEHFVFVAAWERYRQWMARKQESSEDALMYIAFRRMLRDKRLDARLRELLEKIIADYMPRNRVNHKPIKN